MLRSLAWTLRQRRYRALAALMLTVALVCIAAGTFEIHRYQEKHHDNSVLEANARAAPASLASGLVPIVGRGPVNQISVRFRTVRASGTFLTGSQQFVDDQHQGGRAGFYVLTPLRTSSGILLVARGFVVAKPSGARPDVVTPPPTGRVTILGRLVSAQTSKDKLGQLGHQEITSINPAEQAARLNAPVYNAYLTLNSGQPGTTDLDAIPQPNLSNPSGGAGELQLLSYVLQWYVFALLALGTPFMFSRGEAREARLRFLGYDPEDVEFGLPAADTSPHRALDGSSVGSAGSLVVREAGSLAVPADSEAAQWERAARLADRYGRSLGRGVIPTGDGAVPARATVRRPAWMEPGAVNRTSADTPHRSPDEYHGDYNDYLWQLAMADGDLPTGPADEQQSPPSQ